MANEHLFRKRSQLGQTLIFDVGTRTSAILLRSMGSILRQCSEDVLMAISHFNLPSRECNKGSVPKPSVNESPKGKYVR